jgi:hypothetical protein
MAHPVTWPCRRPTSRPGAPSTPRLHSRPAAPPDPARNTNGAAAGTCQALPGRPSEDIRRHLLTPSSSDISVTNDLRCMACGLPQAADLLKLVELRGFEPLTPSMRTRCATGLRYSPNGTAASVANLAIRSCHRAPRGSSGGRLGPQSPTARTSASAYWSYSWSPTRAEMSMISALGGPAWLSSAGLACSSSPAAVPVSASARTRSPIP